MTSAGATQPGAAASLTFTSPSYEQAVFLDSGGTFSRLPAALVDEIIAQFPGAQSVSSGPTTYYVVNCSYASQDGSIDFGFGNTIINVPWHQFIWEANGYCFLGVVATEAMDVTWVLGDTFLRAAFGK